MYPGGKGNCYQQIINQMTPHSVYIEPFLGHGYVMKAKRPAALNIGIELNRDVLLTAASSIVSCGDKVRENGRIANYDERIPLPAHTVNNGDEGPPSAGNTVTFGDVVQHRHLWRCRPSPIASSGDAAARFVFLCGDSLDFLQSQTFTGCEFIYCDPPYLMDTRSSQRPLYDFEFGDCEQHERLLSVLLDLPCPVAISGYWSELYADMLSQWRTHSFEAVTRSGNMAQEWLWMNYQEPRALHDYSYLGDDFRERERIKRKAERWVKRFSSLPELERKAVLSRLARADLIAISGDMDQQKIL